MSKLNQLAKQLLTVSILLLSVYTPAFAQPLIRGPYLQNLSPTAVSILWKTDTPTTSRVNFGLATNNLDQSVSQSTPTQYHQLRITNLTPDTTYFYTVGTITTDLTAPDQDFFFTTAPLPGSPKPTRIWVLGDSGSGGNPDSYAGHHAPEVRDAFYNLAQVENRQPDLWLMLGDNAYELGSEQQYQDGLFDVYPQTLQNKPLWPSIGNHETQLSVYYQLFDLPTQAEAGGIPSNSERYYSFDYANIHFIVLDSFGQSHPDWRQATSQMVQWAAADIAATDQHWIVAFWHHAPYSKSNHSDEFPGDVHMREMREIALPILEAGGVDLVLVGHSHIYERSYFLNGAYGYPLELPPFQTLLDLGKILDPGDGRTDGDGPYRKTAGPNNGTVYVVCGSSSRLQSYPHLMALDHPVMFGAPNFTHPNGIYGLGSLILDINNNRIDLRFLRETGVVDDYFTLIKNNTPVAARYAFYNDCAFDNNNPAHTPDDDSAIAKDKIALLPNQPASFANYTSYHHGINGLIIDIQNTSGQLSLADFAFQVGNDNDHDNWPIAPTPTAISIRPGKGTENADRITVTWPNNTITNTWLKTTIKATANTSLEQPDIFFFGNTPGETGNSTTDTLVNATDEINARNNPRTFARPAPITCHFDHNRDGKVDATDQVIARNNITDFTNALNLIRP